MSMSNNPLSVGRETHRNVLRRRYHGNDIYFYSHKKTAFSVPEPNEEYLNYISLKSAPVSSSVSSIVSPKQLNYPFREKIRQYKSNAFLQIGDVYRQYKSDPENWHPPSKEEFAWYSKRVRKMAGRSPEYSLFTGMKRNRSPSGEHTGLSPQLKQANVLTSSSSYLTPDVQQSVVRGDPQDNFGISDGRDELVVKALDEQSVFSKALFVDEEDNEAVDNNDGLSQFTSDGIQDKMSIHAMVMDNGYNFDFSSSSSSNDDGVFDSAYSSFDDMINAIPTTVVATHGSVSHTKVSHRLARTYLDKGLRLRFKKFGEAQAHYSPAGYICPSIIAPMPIGPDNGQREGMFIIIKDVYINGIISLPKKTGQDHDIENVGDELRVMLILDRQCNGALPKNSEVIEIGPGIWFKSDQSSICSFQNVDNIERFIVLSDTIYQIEYGMSNSFSRAVEAKEETLFSVRKPFNLNCQDLNISTRFSGSSGSQSQMIGKNLFLLFCSTTGVLLPGADGPFGFDSPAVQAKSVDIFYNGLMTYIA